MSGTARKIIHETRAALVERFPQCFMPKGRQKLPLKLGIRAEVNARCSDIPPWKIRMAIRDYTGGMSYHAAVARRTPRVDLNGVIVGPPDQAAIDRALMHLSRGPPEQQIKWYGEIVAAPVESGTQKKTAADDPQSGA